MTRRRWPFWIAAVVVLGGCGSSGNTLPGSTPPGSVPAGDGSDTLHLQARGALARYDKAVLDAGGRQDFIPVGGMTGQLGEWEAGNEDNKRSLYSGQIVAAGSLPAAPQSTGRVVWENGATLTVPLISADTALKQLTADGAAAGCPDCVPLRVTGARLSTAQIQTTRGSATVPAWEYTLKGTAVRATRAAVAGSATVTVTPPSWDPDHAPGGLAIQSATTVRPSRQLTVSFTGSPGPASQPCGADYNAEAVESINAVVVVVTAHRHASTELCTAIGAPRTATVDLAQPLGGRAVLEVQQGLPVPVTTTG
jgi:hypothetical protein